MKHAILIVAIALSGLVAISAQTPPIAPQPPLAAAPGAIVVEPSGTSVTLTYFNRPIVTLRARVAGHAPADRVAGAVRRLDELADRGIVGPVGSQTVGSASLITVGGTTVFGLATADIDELAGDTLQGVTADAVSQLRVALDERREAHEPERLLRSGLTAVGGLIVGLALLWLVGRARRVLDARMAALAEKAVSKARIAGLDVLWSSRAVSFERWLMTVLTVGAQLFVAFSTIAFVLRRFPFTRPWGESMRGFLLQTLERLALGLLDAIPGLFTAIVVLLFARFLTRLVALWFAAVEEGRIHVPWLYPETAAPTRRLATLLVWVFAIVVTYPYLPGSQTEAFKGVSVLLGLMVTLGSSGFVNQIMSGFMLTYSRALRPGDFVRIGDVEGTVTHLGVLSTKVRTPRGEEATVPNAVVVSQTTMDYSRYADRVLTPTSVTIGYDAPWRQVEALLLAAAARTPGVRSEPRPFVLQTSLEDFYVHYTLLVSLERQDTKAVILNELHANIQDQFNEHGVQIMSPHYESDPAAPKIVPKAHWAPPPAMPDS